MKLNDLDYKAQSGKNYNFRKILTPFIFLTNILGGVLSIKDADKEQSKLFKEITDANKVKNQSKTSFS